MSSTKDRQISREKELIDMLKNRNIKNFNYSYCNCYIKNGGHPNAYEICDMIEEDNFFHRYRSYVVTKSYGYTQSYKYRDDILIAYVKDNHNNIHKMLAEIPWSLKNKIDSIYNNLIKSQLNK